MDQPGSYIFCSVQRNGSTFACEALSNTGIAGKPGEYLLFFDREKVDEISDEELLQRIEVARKRGTTSNGVFGLKFMWSTASIFFARMKRVQGFGGFGPHEIMVKLFGNVKYIYLERYDKVGQAVSAAKMNQRNAAGVRVSHAKGEEELRKIREFAYTYDYEAIDKAYKRTCIHYLQWQTFFLNNNISPLHITHEDFVTRLEDNLQRIFQYVGIPTDGEVFNTPPALLRQADASSLAWAARYLAEREEHLIK